MSQAIESVLMQVCTMPVVLYIGQDCSTDSTKEICEGYALHYPNKVKVINNAQNLGLVGNTLSVMQTIQADGCSFIAMLDGDDYWCDEYKLQKQIVFFKEHPECGLVHTCFDVLREGKIYLDKRNTEEFGFVFDRIETYVIGNSSVVFKTQLLNMIDFAGFLNQGFKSCDYVMYAIFSSNVSFAFLPIHSTVWRRGHESVSNHPGVQNQISYLQNDLAMWRYLAVLFPNRWTYTEEMASVYLHRESCRIAFRMGDRRRCIEEFKLLPKQNRNGLYLKFFVAHSRLLTRIWHWYKQNHF